MIYKIQKLQKNTTNVIVCCSSEVYKNAVKAELMKALNIYNEYVMKIEKPTDITIAKNTNTMYPLLGDKWLRIIEADELGIKETMQCIHATTSTSVNLVYVKKYKTFKYLSGIDTIKRQGSLVAPCFYLKKLDRLDLMYFIRSYFGQNYSRYISPEIINILNKEYKDKPNAVLDLLVRMKSGLQVNTRQDIIKAIGVGRNSVIKLVVTLLNSSVSTNKGLTMQMKTLLQSLQDLSLGKHWYYIHKDILITLDKFIFLKEMIISGDYNKLHKTLPEYVDEQEMRAYVNYADMLFTSITMQKLLEMRELFTLDDRVLNDSEMEMWLISRLYEFYGKRIGDAKK